MTSFAPYPPAARGVKRHAKTNPNAYQARRLVAVLRGPAEEKAVHPRTIVRFEEILSAANVGPRKLRDPPLHKNTAETAR